MSQENAERAERTPAGAPPPEIEDAYLKRAIAEIGQLNEEIATAGRAADGTLPVMSSGSPRAEIALVKWSTSQVERQEGVAFFGRAGSAVLKSVQRLDIDPLRLYGTVVVKRPVDPPEAAAQDLDWLRRELRIVEPRMVVAMGPEVTAALDALEIPLAEPIRAQPGEIVPWTPTTEVLVVPDIDRSLDDQASKRAFWAAFRTLGTWYAEQPPY